MTYALTFLDWYDIGRAMAWWFGAMALAAILTRSMRRDFRASGMNWRQFRPIEGARHLGNRFLQALGRNTL